MNSSVSNDSLSINLYVKVIIVVIALLTVSSLLNWAVVNNHIGHVLGRMGLYVPMLLGLGFAVVRKPVPGMFWLLAGFSVVILFSLTHPVESGGRGFIVASCYFLILGQLISGYRLQDYAAKLSLILVVLMILGMLYEQFLADFAPGVLSVSPRRAALFFMNPNLAALGLCLLTFSAVTILPRAWQFLLWVFVVFAILTTGSRSTLLALFVVFIAWLILDRKSLVEGVKKFKLAAFAMLAVLLLAVWGGYTVSPKFQIGLERTANVVNFVDDDFSGYFVRRKSVDDDPLFDEDGRAIVSRYVRARLLVRAWDVYWLAPWAGHSIDGAYALSLIHI